MQKARDSKFTKYFDRPQLTKITINRPAADAPSQMTDRDRANLSRPIDYTSIRSVPEIWAIAQQVTAIDFDKFICFYVNISFIIL